MVTARMDTGVLSPAILGEIVRKFGQKVYKIDSCRKIWRLQTSAGYKYLKRSKLTPADVWFIHDALQYLSRRNFNHVPGLAVSQSGDPFVIHETGLYILTDWYFSYELDFRVLGDLREAARFMAEFHLAGQGFTPNHPSSPRSAWFSWPGNLSARITQLQDFRRLAQFERKASPFSRLYDDYFDPFYREAITSYQALLRSPYPEVAQLESKKKRLCHHDYSGRNLLRTFNNQLLLVDFDYCLRDIRIHDLLNFMIRNLKHTDWNGESCRVILREYQQVDPLAPEELEVLRILAHWPQDFWQVGHQYYYEKLPWPRERFLKKLERKINSRQAREKFLKEFKPQ